MWSAHSTDQKTKNIFKWTSLLPLYKHYTVIITFKNNAICSKQNKNPQDDLKILHVMEKYTIRHTTISSLILLFYLLLSPFFRSHASLSLFKPFFLINFFGPYLRLSPAARRYWNSASTDCRSNLLSCFYCAGLLWDSCGGAGLIINSPVLFLLLRWHDGETWMKVKYFLAQGPPVTEVFHAVYHSLVDVWNVWGYRYAEQHRDKGHSEEKRPAVFCFIDCCSVPVQVGQCMSESKFRLPLCSWNG